MIVPEKDGWYWYSGSYRNLTTGELHWLDWEVVKIATSSVRGKSARHIQALYWKEKVKRMESLNAQAEFIKIDAPKTGKTVLGI